MKHTKDEPVFKSTISVLYFENKNCSYPHPHRDSHITQGPGVSRQAGASGGVSILTDVTGGGEAGGEMDGDINENEMRLLSQLFKKPNKSTTVPERKRGFPLK